MNEAMSYKRNPSIECWIKHIKEGLYDENEKIFHTIFGKVKRIRIVATVIEKKESLIESDENDIGLDEPSYSNVRFDFDLDDSTGLMRAIIRNVNPLNFKEFNKGDIVDVIGRVSKYRDLINLWIEIMRKVEEPNHVLLRNAEIIKKIKNEEIHKIPEFETVGKKIEEISSEIDVNTLFENKDASNQLDELKEKIYLIIEEYSTKGNRISFERLKKEVEISDSELRSYINDLIRESRIYESEKNNFESF